MTPPIFTLLNVNDFTLSEDPSNPGFSDYVNQTIDDAAGDDDGFDSAVADVLALLDLLDSGLSAIAGADGGTLDDVFTEAFEIDPADVAADTAAFAQNVPDYEAGVGDLGNVILGTVQQTTNGGGGTVWTPDAASNCSASNNVLFFTGTASDSPQYFDLNIADPFDIGAHLTDITLGPTTDPPFFNLVGMASAYLTGPDLVRVGILNGVFANPGDYWCQIGMTFILDAGQGGGSLSLCVRVRIS